MLAIVTLVQSSQRGDRGALRSKAKDDKTTKEEKPIHKYGNPVKKHDNNNFHSVHPLLPSYISIVWLILLIFLRTALIPNTDTIIILLLLLKKLIEMKTRQKL